MFDANFPEVRLRRLRQSEGVRNLCALPLPGPEKFLYPVFLVEGNDIKQEIASMPGQYRWSLDRLPEIIEKIAIQKIGGVILFGVPGDDKKSKNAHYCYQEDGLVQQGIEIIKRNYPSLLIFTDVCICAYTRDGHCGIHQGDHYNCNDITIDILAKMAISHAKAGADGVAPSAMMDGQVKAIREGLDRNGFNDTLLMSYSTKFASSMYGPFRDAAGSAPGKGDRKGYQADYRDRRTALRESRLDLREGADILMVKPAMFYLDLIRELRDTMPTPLAAYNVSGEYAMLIATAEKGWGDLKGMVKESIYAMSRAGTDIFISYWADRYDELIKA